MHFHAEWALNLLTVPGARIEHERSSRFRNSFELQLEKYRRPISQWLLRTSGGRIGFDDLLPRVVDSCFRRFGVVANSFYAFPPKFVQEQFRSARTAQLRQWEREKADEAVSQGETSDVEYDYGELIDLCDAVGWTREEFSVLAHWLYSHSPSAERDATIEATLRAKYVAAAESANPSDKWSAGQEMLNKYLQGCRQQEIASEYGVTVSTVNKRLHNSANVIAVRLHDPNLGDAVHSFSEYWSKRARKTWDKQEQEVREPVDHAQADRWREFHQRLLQDLAATPVLQRVAKLAPYRTVEQLDEYVAFVDPSTDLETVLGQIHEVAMRQFAPAPSETQGGATQANPVATYRTSAQR